MSQRLETDVPMGAMGRLMGLRVIPPKLQVGEEVRWSTRANRMQHKVRVVGGRLYLTNSRLIFGRSKFESLLGGKEWSASLNELTAAVSGAGRMRMIRIMLANGGVERFIVADKNQFADIVDAAIQEAGSASSERP